MGNRDFFLRNSLAGRYENVPLRTEQNRISLMKKKTYIAPRQEVVIVNSSASVCDTALSVNNASGSTISLGRSRDSYDEEYSESEYGALW